MNRQTPLKVSALALLLSVLAYAVAWCVVAATKSVAFADPAVPLTVEFLAATLRYWSTFAACLSAIASVMTYFAFKKAHAGRLWKVTFWISGVLSIAVVLPIAFMIWIFDKPIHIQNRALLKAINADARTLLAEKFVTTKAWSENADHEFESGDIAVRKARWPHAIASLSPQWVTVSPGQAVDVLTTPFFDGGWGYRIQPGNNRSPEPKGRYEYLGQDVYAFHPY